MTPAAPHILGWADVPPQPWRNGGGVTRELLTWPPAADWQLRLSVAEVQRSGPFSAFPGVERWFAVLEGEGVELVWPGRVVVLRAGDAPCRFDGGQAPDCRLLGGATRDLNLMLHGARGGLWPAVPGLDWQADCTQAGLFTRDALQVQAADTPPFALPPMSLCWWSAAPTRLQVLADATPHGTAPLAWWITCQSSTSEPSR